MEDKKSKGKKGKKKITFLSVVKKIIVGRSIRAGIEGSMRGKLLLKAELPMSLEFEVAKQIDASLPDKRRKSSLKGFKKSVVFSDTILEDGEDGDSDVFGDEHSDGIDLEELEDAFDHFLDKLENLVKSRQNRSE